MLRGLRTLGVGCVGAVAILASACVPDQPTTTNQAPTAAFTADPTSGVAPLVVSFNGAASSDPDGSITAYAWDFGDGGTATGATPSHTFNAAGTPTVTLTVTDNSGATDTETATITVTAAPVNQPPTAVFTPSTTSGTSPLTVGFDSSASTDADGTIVGHSWAFGDGGASTDPHPVHTFTAVGPHVVTLTVSDDDGAVHTASATIDVLPNPSPVALADASPLPARINRPVDFFSAGSNDPGGEVITYSWAFGDGATSTDPNPTHIYAIADVYTAVLTVTDAVGQTDTDQVTIHVEPNGAPVAQIVVDPFGGRAPWPASFVGSGSTDLDGSIESYSWSFGDGGTSTDPDPTHTYTTGGEFSVTLTVTDDEGATDTDTVTMYVGSPIVPPTAAISADLSTVREGKFVEFDFTGTGDADGPIVGATFDPGDGSPLPPFMPPGQPLPMEYGHRYFTPGTYQATITVYDADGASATASVTIVVVPNQAPVAAATTDAVPGKAPVFAEFDASTSSDADGEIVSYDWDFGEGLPGHGVTAGHRYDSDGPHTVTLTVTDDSGATDTATFTIVVIPNTGPTAVINAAPQSGVEELHVLFDAEGSVDPDGDIIQYEWDFGDGTVEGHVFPGGAHFYAAGTWSATLTVTDDDGATDTSDPIVITVTPDADDDGVSAPADCDDTDASIHPGAFDEFDDGIDQNCDTVDGDASVLTFVRQSGGVDGPACGTLAAPCATIGGAITRATGGPIVVAGGTYPSFEILDDFVRIRGGYGQNFLRGAAATGATTTTVTASYRAALGGPVAIYAFESFNSEISDLTVQGADAPAGQPSYGIVLDNTNNRLTRVTVNAGRGGAGVAGSSGASASQTPANGGGAGEASERAAACSSSRKNGGGGGTTATIGANGGGGGQGGARDSSCPFSLSATNGNGGGGAATTGSGFGNPGGGGSACDCGQAGAGGDGESGRTAHGAGGTAGSSVTPAGVVGPNGQWSVVGGTGGNGTLGLDGTGGGGGGGGGGNDSGTDSMGGGGGGGGAGGARATAFGTGGTAGQASIGIVIVRSFPELVDVVVNLGTGGAGGAGGAGGLGQPGGSAGPGGPTSNPGGRGGNGGAGGSGGNSGAGGGGAGGAALGLAVGVVGYDDSGVTYAGGVGGAGGAGGSGGVSGATGASGPRTTFFHA